jgi:hypothetical protein
MWWQSCVSLRQDEQHRGERLYTDVRAGPQRSRDWRSVAVTTEARAILFAVTD